MLKPKPRKTLVQAGQTYGKYKVLRKNGRDKERRQLWLCECECGTRKNIRDNQLLGGRHKQCNKCRHKDYGVFMHNMLTDVWNEYKKAEEVNFKKFWPNANSN